MWEEIQSDRFVSKHRLNSAHSAHSILTGALPLLDFKARLHSRGNTPSHLPLQQPLFIQLMYCHTPNRTLSLQAKIMHRSPNLV